MVSEIKKYPSLIWRPFFDITTCYLAVAGAICLSSYSMYFYPISIVICANRILTLSLLSHESLHGSLFKNRRLNNFFGRWFCAFPTFISFSRYRKLHLLHHKAIGHKSYDPDYHLYKNYPQNCFKYFKNTLADFITLKILWQFLEYYTEIPAFIFPKENIWTQLKKNSVHSDFVQFLFFNIFLFLVLIYFSLYKYFILFWLMPLLLITQPYVLLMGGLQHGPIPYADKPELLSRSVRGPKWLMEIVLPLNINFHAEHHLDSTIPHYWLKTFSADLKNTNRAVWQSSYKEALKNLFR